MAASPTAAVVDKFIKHVSTVFKNNDYIDFPDAQLQVLPKNHCILKWNTPQDDSCPGHILEWDDTDPDYIIVTSSQYPKKVASRKSKSPGSLRFMVPTKIERGMRELVRDTMEDLDTDPGLQEKTGIKSVSLVEDTPRKAVWHLTRTEERQD
ncbi:hypothetical protein VCV18_008439 [Metarhizium anisopliae]